MIVNSDTVHCGTSVVGLCCRSLIALIQTSGRLEFQFVLNAVVWTLTCASYHYHG
jgi:hypothetical protein